MAEKKDRSSNFLVQGSILALASIISRIIGLIYRVPMTNIIGDIGNNYYACAYDIYNVMLIISSYSLPLAVSKLVSSQMAKQDRHGVWQILRGSLLFAVTAGGIAALIVFFGADFFTGTVLKTPYSFMALRVLAPALLVVAVLGVLRGFFQGLGTMVPSALSQIIEQIVNAFVSVYAAYSLFRYGKNIGEQLGDPEHYAAAYGAAGGTLGTNLGSVAALIFMLIFFFITIRAFVRRMKQQQNVTVDPFLHTMKVLVLTIIPVLLSTTIYNISGIVDQGIFKNLALYQGATEADIDVWWGVFAGKYKLMTNVPISIASALAASSVPALTSSYGKGDLPAVRKKIDSATRLTMVVAFPCAVGLAVLSDPIFRVLFPSTVESIALSNQMMRWGAIAVIFFALSTLTNGLLQGIDRLRVPVRNAAVSLAAQILLLVVLMLFFHMQIMAVVIANAAFGLLMCVLNAVSLAHYSGYHQEILRTFVIPAVCSLLMGLFTYLIYFGLHALCGSMLISMVMSIVCAVVVYAVLLLLFGGVNEEELRSFPKGNLLVKITKRLHLLKK